MPVIGNHSRHASIAQFIAHVRTPLYRNGYALLLSSGVTSGLGVVYWVVAARIYSTEVVGLNSAAIAAMTFLAGVSQLNLMSALVRFIPCAGPATQRFVMYSYLISILVASVASPIFIAGLNAWAPSLTILRSNPFFVLVFTLAVMGWCIFTLQDNVLIGLGQAVWVPIENGCYAVAKIALLLLFAASFPRYGVFASWVLPVSILLLAVNALIFRLIPTHLQETQQDGALVASQVVRFVAADYVIYLFSLSSTFLLPIIVTRQAGATANAYYYLCWQVAYFLYLVSSTMCSSLVAETARNPAMLRAYSRDLFVQTLRVVMILTAIIALSAPIILRVFGMNYAREGAMTLRLLALSAIPYTVNSVYINICRVQRRMSAAVVAQASLSTLVLVLSFVGLSRYGIAGVGVACLVGQTSVAIPVLFAQLRTFWSKGQTAGTTDRS